MNYICHSCIFFVFLYAVMIFLFGCIQRYLMRCDLNILDLSFTKVYVQWVSDGVGTVACLLLLFKVYYLVRSMNWVLLKFIILLKKYLTTETDDK